MKIYSILILILPSLSCLSHPMRNTIGYKIEKKGDFQREIHVNKMTIKVISSNQNMDVDERSFENLEKCFEAAFINSGLYSKVHFEREWKIESENFAEISFLVEDSWKFSYYKNPYYLTEFFFIPFNGKGTEARLFWPGIIPATYPYITILPFVPKAGKINVNLKVTFYEKGVRKEEVEIVDSLEYQTFFWGVYRTADAEFTSTLLFPRVFDRLAIQLKKAKPF
ncbi:MAG: hypothetical protein O9264_01645 [Leptospira sp.]|nr:hypothetical protein [Leptospira sp.]